MTPLRKRMIEDMKLAGLSDKTQKIYLQWVSALARHYRKSPSNSKSSEFLNFKIPESPKK
jgi:hypothetical protein